MLSGTRGEGEDRAVPETAGVTRKNRYAAEKPGSVWLLSVSGDPSNI